MILDILAEYIHKKFSLEKKESGWKFGIDFDEDKKIDPMLVSWGSLDKIYQNHIIESIKEWPEILAKSNFKIEKLNFLCYCDAQMKLGQYLNICSLRRKGITMHEPQMSQIKWETSF